MIQADAVRSGRRRIEVLGAFGCLVGAAVIYCHEMTAPRPFEPPLYGFLPWLVLLIGLVRLLRVLNRTKREADLLAILLMIAGMGSIVVNPFTMLFGAHWLLVIGMALPCCFRIAAHFPRLPPARSGPGGEPKP